ncbi:MAG: hypothetical protein JWQ90_62 [Hydrocarboniphaga sp.]|uniref:hypothetical protein n=1 Tax=Hydrocarboniphaga sp. TaxID=2033016 RepID=UPI00261D6465|nr:hypothetical protein [Hydrocarboniphaga sp.]MDB5967612.1 hypothetical protein [Hydrocarboniphaga sp.]
MPSKLEMLKDVLQVAVESGAERVGRITTVITGAVRDVAREVGEWAGDVLEVVEAARKAPSAGKPDNPEK